MFQHASIASSKRKGAVLVFALVMLLVLLGFASLTLDVGAMYNARADLQNAADAAALAGASMLADESMIPIRLGKQTSTSEIFSTVFERSSAVASHLTSFGGKNVVLESGDVLVGWIDTDSSTSAIDLTTSPSKLNAVHVIAKRTKTSANGPVQLYFASIFGKSTTDVTASATAAFDDRVAGLETAQGPTLFPFTIHVDTYDQLLAAHIDAYAYDKSNGTVSPISDTIPEIDIFPHKLSPGNFGRLSIGSADLNDQILNGVSEDDLELEVGVPNLEFYDGDGASVTYQMDGDTGMKASLEDVIEKRVGDIVAIPIHSGSAKTGSNTTFTIVGLRFVRVMHVELSGGNKGMSLQPVTYLGNGVILSQAAPSSGGIAGRMVLVR